MRLLIAVVMLLVGTVGGLQTLALGAATFVPRPVAEPATPVAIGHVALTPTAAPVPVVSGLSNLIDVAKTWLGTPYLFGGCTRKGIDCSCFVLNVLAVFEIHVPRTTVQQKAFDRPVSRNQLQPGDTLFFDNTCTDCGANPTHEGMYIGGGLMIDAGSPVKIESIDTPYWRAHWDSAGRAPGL